MRRLALALCLAFGCSSSTGPNLPDGDGLASQVAIQGDDAPAAAVRVDSVVWRVESVALCVGIASVFGRGVFSI